MMRTIEIILYSFDELIGEARDKAIQNLRYQEMEGGYAWDGEALDSLKAFADHFGHKLTDYSVAWDASCHSTATFCSDWFDPEEHDMAGKVAKLKTDGSCQWTGYCMDDACNDGAVQAWRDGEREPDAILQAGFESWLSSCQSDYEGQLEESALIECAVANSLEFTEDGEIH